MSELNATVSKSMDFDKSFQNEMTDLNIQSQPSDSALKRYWRRIPILIRAIISGFAVFAVGGVIVWNAVLALVPLPWPLVVMPVPLLIYWKYYSGSWRPKSSAQIRRESFRATKLSMGVWLWSLTAAALMVIIFQSIIVVTFRIFEFPAEATALGIDLSSFPIWQVWLLLILTSAVAGITEEVGFRGYMQVPLEKRYGPVAGIIIVMVIFMLFHLNSARGPADLLPSLIAGLMFGIIAYTSDSLIPAVIAHTVTDIIGFTYWRTDVAGTFDYRIIAETGIDSHFILWVLILVASVVLFIGAARRTLSARRQM
jgi:membrane protease YdiL (CAAX protease family)